MRALPVFILTLAALLCSIFAAEARTPSLASSCRAQGGQWSALHRECAMVSQRWCARRGGRFEPCASACRHNPDKTAPCIMMCVPVCIIK
ncbi:MAG: hypothetical protein ACRCYS_19345 [Beijerinckiaceae bacterium]